MGDTVKNNKCYICFVRLLSIILAILVMTLSVQPVCMAASEGHSCCVNDALATTASAETHDEDGSPERECNSNCNPFQVCACCACCIVLPQVFAPQPPPVFTFIPPVWNCTPVPAVDAPVYGVWQPPQLA
jgi:hypothetical protein